MARNIEIKARIVDKKLLIIKVEKITTGAPIEIRQDDTFFCCINGRLKLWQLSPILGELIYYARPDMPGPKMSTYVITETTEPEQLRKTLESALGINGRVRKKRLLYMCGTTRIHIDEVEGLGDFVELEVVLDDADTVETGQRIAEELMMQLGIRLEDLQEGAYVDMLSVSIL
jgi:predicted adenylyl cyclase CyaB